MKIYFCDLCNESIPLQDIKDNVAATLKGKIYCKICNPLKEVQASVTRQQSSTVTTLLLILMIVLISVLIGLMLFQQQGPEVDYAKGDDLRLLSNEYGDLSSSVSDLKEEIIAINTNLDGKAEDIDKVSADIRLVKGDLLGARSEISNMLKNFQSVTNIRERVDSFHLKQGEFTTSLRDIIRSIDSCQMRLVKIETRIQDADASGISEAGASKNVKPDDKVEPGFTDPAVEEIKKQLSSKDDADRFEAVYRVQDDRVKEALPFVTPLIHDPDQFVQIGAIQAVGELLYLEALPDLVKALRDQDVTVRDEALRQLRRMTGKDELNFDVRASQGERDKAVKKWEKWLKDRK